MKNKKSLSRFIIFLVAFIVFTLIIKFVDVQKIGPMDSEVGLGSINGPVRDFINYNDTFYKISEILGYLSFLLVGFYGIVGLIQLIKRKSLLKVDKEILILGGFYVVVLLVYILFDKVAINYRPFLEKGALEPSYPSSHTILSLCVCISSLIMSAKVIKDKGTQRLLNLGTTLLMVGIVVTRLLSGVHWFTDIIGGILISLALCSLFNYLVNDCSKVKKK
jgi:undecaprenyl-diphosphatase